MTTKEISKRITDLESKRDLAQQELSEVRAAITSALLEGTDPCKLQGRAASLAALIEAVPDALTVLEEQLRKAQASEEADALVPEIVKAKKAEGVAAAALETFFQSLNGAIAAGKVAASALKESRWASDPVPQLFRLFAFIRMTGFNSNAIQGFEDGQRELLSNLGPCGAWSSNLEAKAKALRAAAEGAA